MSIWGFFPISISKTKINFETKKKAQANVLNNNCYYESGKSFFSYAVRTLLEVQFVLSVGEYNRVINWVDNVN